MTAIPKKRRKLECILSKDDQIAFAAAILNPPKPSKKLVEAAKCQKKRVESR